MDASAASGPNQPRWQLLNNLQARERFVAYLCLAPWLVGFIAFTIGPIVVSLFASFTDYPVLHPVDTHWVGLDNYRTALHDSTLAHAVVVTALYVALVVPGDLVVGLILALILNARVRGITFFRTIFFLPVLLAGTGGASVAIALLWVWIFQPQFGLLNFLLSLVHLPPQLWIYSERLVVPSLALMSLWGVGRSMLIYLAGLQGLPTDILWAAQLDGASAWRRFWRVTLPLISPTLLFNLILDLIGAFQTFTQVDVVTQGGPNNASLFYMLYLYRNAFSYLQMGYASTLAWIMFGMTIVITAIIFLAARRWVFYQGAVSH
ncbi:MAG: sugar ABC transporter permease [Chloroflexota bacterium]